MKKILSTTTSLLLASAALSEAHPLSIKDWKTTTPDSSWSLPGNSGTLITQSSHAQQELVIPALGDKEAAVSGDWRMIISADVYGCTDSTPAQIILEALDPATGQAFASAKTSTSTPAPRATCSITTSSAQGDNNAEKTCDNDPSTIWHSAHNVAENPAPHTLTITFGKAQPVTGLRYIPRSDGGNGSAKEGTIEIQQDGKWEHIKKLNIDYADRANPTELKFLKPKSITGMRLTIHKDQTGGGFGAAAEFTPLGIPWPMPKDTISHAKQRLWIEIPSSLLTKLTGHRILLKATTNSPSGVVIGQPDAARIHLKPSPELYGRSNGGTGPDKLGAGLLGFDALTEHLQKTLTIMTVRSNSPASKAGLKSGDAILAVSNLPLPLNDLNPGWDWFHHSHEAIIGRATQAALAAGKNQLTLHILRDSLPTPITLTLPREKPFTTMDPATDSAAADLLSDQIKYLTKNQKENGSWSDDIIRTCWSSLALMATREKKHRSAVSHAVDWAKEKYPTPDTYGNLGFWSGAYACILYSEWHLATGDKSVLPHLAALRDWAHKGKHMSTWDVYALGHGPDGLPYENKALVAPACHLLVAEALAQKCDTTSALWELLMPYMEMSWSDPKQGGHGAMGYNRSYKDTEEFWSRSGLFAITCHLRNTRPDMKDAMINFMKKNHPWLRNTHAYGEPGSGWGLLALNLTQPTTFAKILPLYDWSFSLAWEPGYGLHYTTPHMGSPYMGEDDLINAVYPLILQAPRKTITLTGATDRNWW